MGLGISKDEYIRKHPKIGNADRFYFACRDGDINYVRHGLKSMTLEQLNQLQPNGSTYLHAAAFTGRVEIVRMLLEHGCSRSVLNRYGLTAYQEAWSAEIQNLFHRPKNEMGTSPFVDIGIGEIFQLAPSLISDGNMNDVQTNSSNNDSSHQAVEIDDDGNFEANRWIDVFNRFDKHGVLMLGQILKSSIFCRLLGLKRAALHPMVDYIIETSMTDNDRNNGDFLQCLAEYKKTRDVKKLLTLYTHQASFYTTLRDPAKAGILFILLYRHSSTLRSRFYRGSTYRGMKLTKQELLTYVALSRRDAFAFINHSFQSSTRERNLAEQFLQCPPDMPKDSNEREYGLLIEYEFPEYCESAIDLGLVNGFGLSIYPHEAEVIILPYTVFEIIDMNWNGEQKEAYMRVKHIPPRGLIANFKLATQEFTRMSPDDIKMTMGRMERNWKTILEFQNASYK